MNSGIESITFKANALKSYVGEVIIMTFYPETVIDSLGSLPPTILKGFFIIAMVGVE